MKLCIALVAAFFAAASFPLVAQQPTAAEQPGSHASQPAAQQAAPAPEPTQQNNPETSSAPMSPVNGELVSRLDSKTAKNGDNVVVRTKDSVKTAEGIDIPKGSKLMGHVVAVKASEPGANSQVVLQFDHVELKGGQSLPVHSQIQSISPPEGLASANGYGATSTGAMGSPTPQEANRSPDPDKNTPGQNEANGGNRMSGDSGTSPAEENAPAPGIVVAKNGNIAIETTSIPGVLLANNAAGQQDPRMTMVSSILLGAKKDIELNSGTQMVVGVSAARAGAQ